MLDIFFDGVERDNTILVLVKKRGTPDFHAMDVVLFGDSTLLQKETDVVSEWPRWIYRATRISEIVETIKLW